MRPIGSGRVRPCRTGWAIYTAAFMLRRVGLLLLLVTFATVGCVRRSLSVSSNPPGALLYLNGVEVGRTPIEKDFTWYGTYDVELRKEGYETLKTRGKVIAPWWQWVPFDFFAEALPLTDRKSLSYSMAPVSDAAVDPEQLLHRAEAMAPMLESSPRTPATTRAAH